MQILKLILPIVQTHIKFVVSLEMFESLLKWLTVCTATKLVIRTQVFQAFYGFRSSHNCSMSHGRQNIWYGRGNNCSMWHSRRKDCLIRHSKRSDCSYDTANVRCEAKKLLCEIISKHTPGILTGKLISLKTRETWCSEYRYLNEIKFQSAQ